MPAQTNTNVSPYYDDFNPESNFHRVLFKPGYPVQARELTQSQTILQDQVERLSSAFLKDGDNVAPGRFTYNNITPYVRCASITQGATAQEFVGFKLRGVSSGVVAVVDFATELNDEDDVTFYVTYLSSGDSTEEQQFLEGEVLESDTPNNYTATVGVNEVSKPIITPPLGFGSIFSVDEGYFFVNGFMVRNDAQTIPVEKYSIKPTVKVGFVVDEDFINSNEDPSLLDNSQGASNFAAPGADRLKISLILSVRDRKSFDPDFITLATIVDGAISGDPLRNNKYDWVNDLLAKRTFDESGDYIVTEFPIKPLEYVNSEFLDGIKDPLGDGKYPPPNPFESDINLTFDEANSLYAINVSPGNAYVQGYNVQFINPFNIYGNKARDTGFLPETYTQINPGYRVDITNVSSTPDFQNNRGVVDTVAFSPVICYRNFNDGFTGSSLTIGDATTSPPTERRPLNNSNKPWKTYHIVTDASVGSFGDLETEDGYYKVTIKHNRTDTESEAILVYPDKSTITLNPNTDLNNVSIGNSIVVRLLPTTPGVENDELVIRGDEIGVGSTPTYNCVTLISVPFQPLKTGILYPKYLQNENLVERDSSAYGFNSTFKMGVLDTYFYDDLSIISDPLTDDLEWEIGNKLLGETSRTVSKLEDVYEDSLVVSNTSGSFKNGEIIQQVINSNLPNNTYNTYVPTPDPTTGLSGLSFNVNSVVDSNGLYKIYVDYSSTEDLSDYIKGGYVTETAAGYTYIHANVVDATYDNNTSILEVVIDKDLGLTNSSQVVISGLIFRATTLDNAPDVKKGKIVRRGEVAKLYFDDFIGNTNPPGQTPGDGIQGSIYTVDVNLISPSSSRGLRLPPESGLSTQSDANTWFYYSILSLLGGEGSSQIFIDENEPITKNFGDLWIDPLYYSVAVWDGQVWYDIVAGSETDSHNPDPTNSLTQGAISDYLKNKIEDSRIKQLAKEALLARASEFDVIDPMLVPENYDLSFVEYVDVTAIGSVLRLHTIDSSDADLGPAGQVLPDIYYDEETNSIELTEDGRNKIYSFPFFDSAITGAQSNPRINYRLKTNDFVDSNGNTQKGIFGYALSFPSVIQNTFKNVKSFFSESDDSSAVDFTADISTQSRDTTEIFTIANRSTFSGSAGRNYIVCDNFDGDPSRELVAGDLVTFTNDTGIVENKIVFSATEPYGYGTTKTKSVIYFTTTLISNATSKQLQRVRISSDGSMSEGNLIQLQEDVIKSLETDQNITNINYEVYRQFTESIDEGDQEVVITLTPSNERIVPDLRKTSIFVVGIESPPPSFDLNTQRSLIGRPLTIKDSTIQSSGREITLHLNKPAAAKYNVKVIIAVEVTNAKARKKVLEQDKEVILAYDENNVLNPQLSPASQSIISLGKADVYKIKSVTTTDSTGNIIDLIDNYVFDDGQTEDVYGISLLRKKEDSPIPTNDVKVVFDYFRHDPLVGGFFSVDSYTHNDGVLYDKIPTFTPRKTSVKRKNTSNNPPRKIELRGCVDFRPIVNTDSTTGSVLPLLNITDPSDKLINYLNRKVSGDAFTPAIPVPGSQFRCDIQNYLPKIDSLFLDKTGKVVLISGESSINPVAPSDLSTGIRLYDITIPAYTFDISQLSIKKYNYRRYTMKDIFDIDKRVDRVEDLVSLSLLESAALTTEVRDSVTGLGRFKNGVIVDPFRNHFKGNVGNSQYRVSVDPKESHLRPSYHLDQIHLEERYDTDDVRLDLGGYVNNNGIVTLPFEETEFIEQNFATRFVNLQPYSSFTYEGKVTLNPPIDTFKDINTPSQLVIEDNSIYDALLNQTNEDNLLNIGTVWGEWENNDSTVSTRNLGRISNRSQNKLELSNTGLISFNGNSTNSSNMQLTENSESITQSRGIIRNYPSISGSSVSTTSYGDRVLDLQLSSTMRSIPVFFKVERLKPNTRYHVFFDDINVSDWVSPDSMFNTYPDGKPRYNGISNSNPGGFGVPIISDSDGNISGVFIIPNGRSPVKGSKFDGNLLNVEYNTTGPTRSFTTGHRSIRFTSSIDNTNDISQLEGFAQTEFISSSVLLDKQDTIVSTRQPEYTTNLQISEDIRINSSLTPPGAFIPKAPPPQRPVSRDPIAQTFYVDGTNEDGVFVSDLDLYFKSKDNTQGIEVYLVSTEQGAPTAKIVPHSRVVKKSDSIIRVKCNLNGLNTATLEQGTTIVGSISGAVGVISSNVKFVSGFSTDSTPNVNNTTYEVVLSNYLNEFIPGEPIVPQVSPPSQAKFEIVQDEVQITRVDILDMGSDYNVGDVIEISAPDLPGGVRAEAEITVADVINDPNNGKPYPEGRQGQIYKVTITNPGSGYTKKPSATVTSVTGRRASFNVRVSKGRHAVDMGVSTSDDATAVTKFKFDSPVYLLSNQSYAFVIKCPTSLNYNVWISKLGESVIGSNKRVSQQPNLGSIFRSSNNDVWSEDQTEDIKFNLRRCKFTTNLDVNLPLQNSPIPMVKLPRNPIQVSKGLNGPNDDESIFGLNHKVIRVYSPNNGLSPKDLVIIEGIDGLIDGNNVENIGGIPVEDINGLHQVVESDLNYFTILIDTVINDKDVITTRGGGKNVMCSVNRPYETINLYSGVIGFKNTSVTTFNRATNHAGISLYNQDKQYIINDEKMIPIMDTYYYDGAKQVASEINEAKYKSEEFLNKGKSLRTRFVMKTHDDKLSPVIDVTRTNMNVIRNQIDDPIFKYSSGGSNSFPSIPETSSDGTTFSKWISKTFMLENPCDGIQLKLSSVVYDQKDIRAYYAAKTIGSQDNPVTNWIPFNISSDGDGYPDNVKTISPRSTTNIDPRQINADEWQTIVWSVQDVSRFDSVSIKIVMTSKNPAKTPIIDDLRLICTE